MWPSIRRWEKRYKAEGPSGACGFNKVLGVEIPFMLTRVG